jgi:membrane protease YdiL (CAAX protease family)
MKMGDFLILLSLFFSGQLVYQLVMTVVELILNSFGLSVLKGMAAVSMDMENFSMFLYGGILAPVTEELLFRGLVQRTLQPYGKRFAILCSAFTFGIFHGNLLQAPYAFLVGLVLGYVASEYSIAWAMLLHMLNNLVLGDMLPRLTGGLPEYVSGLILFAVLIPCAVVSIVMLVVKRESIRTYRRENPVYGYSVRCFFSSGGIITLMVLMGISMIASIFIMVGPM